MGRSYFWLDGAHNVHGARALVKIMRETSQEKWNIIFGALDTRPAEKFLACIAPICAELLAVTIPQQPAALKAEEITYLAQKMSIKAKSYPNLKSASAHIAHQNGPVMICGSLYLAGSVLEINGTWPD